MSFAVPQSSFTNFTTNATSQTYQYPSAVTAGNLLVCGVATVTDGLSTGTLTVSDNVNGSWTRATVVAENAGSDLCLWVFYLPKTAVGQPTLTFNYSKLTSFYIHVAEVSGADPSVPPEGFGAGQSSTGGTMVASSFNTSTADFIYCAAIAFGTITSTAGWTQLQFDAVTSGMYSLYQVQGSAGTESASFNLNTTTHWWLIIDVGFKPFVGPTTGSVPSGTALTKPEFAAKFLYFDTGDYSIGI